MAIRIFYTSSIANCIQSSLKNDFCLNMQGWRKHCKLQVSQNLRRNCLHEHKQPGYSTPLGTEIIMLKFYEVAEFKIQSGASSLSSGKVYITSQKKNIQSIAGFI